MSKEKHVERHFSARNIVRDAVIGLADGLTVPFALAAGLAGSVGSVAVIVIAGLAEIAAGSIAMGLGGYLAARGDVEHYRAERRREEQEIVEVPAEEEWEVEDILAGYGVDKKAAQSVVAALRRNPNAWADFMMRFELGLERPEAGRAITSAITIAVSYIAGGLVPLVPYMLMRATTPALIASTVVTMIALAVFGAAKSRIAGVPVVGGTLKTLAIGAAAAGAAYLIARLIS